MENTKISRFLIRALEDSSHITHIVIATALIAATVLITLYFFQQLYLPVQTHTLIDGFLHALGLLLLL